MVLLFLKQNIIGEQSYTKDPASQVFHWQEHSGYSRTSSSSFLVSLGVIFICLLTNLFVLSSMVCKFHVIIRF